MKQSKGLSMQIEGSNVGTISVTTDAVPAHVGRLSDWQRWAPYAAVAWSLGYAALGVYWALGGAGFPFVPGLESDYFRPAAGKFGVPVDWVIVVLAGFPAAAMGTAMLRGVRSRVLRSLFITAGALLAGVLLLLMTDITLLMALAYIPYIVFRSLIGADVGRYIQMISQNPWMMTHELLCLIGGFLWLGATVSYSRRSGDACLYCGRRDGPEGWTSPQKAARWGRIAVYAAMIVPLYYALTRYAWALGIPLGMTHEYWRLGQQRGEWVSGLFLATFGLVGAILMLGLVQRWGEAFPRWMIGLAGRRVPIALAVVPASLASVLFIVGGIAALSGWSQMSKAAAATGQDMSIVVGPLAVFPLWGVALAVGTLGYYFRRRGLCSVCGRGASGEIGSPSSGSQRK